MGNTAEVWFTAREDISRLVSCFSPDLGWGASTQRAGIKCVFNKCSKQSYVSYNRQIPTWTAVTHTAVSVIPATLAAAGTAVLHSMKSRVRVTSQTVVRSRASAMSAWAVTWLTNVLRWYNFANRKLLYWVNKHKGSDSDISQVNSAGKCRGLGTETKPYTNYCLLFELQYFSRLSVA